MITRCFSPPLNIMKERCVRCDVPVAVERFLCDCEVGWTFELERAEMRMPSHQGHFEDGVLECRMCLLWHHCNTPRDVPPRHAGQDAAIERDRAAVGGQHSGEQLEQRGLAAAVGADQASQRSASDADADVAKGIHRFGASASCCTCRKRDRQPGTCVSFRRPSRRIYLAGSLERDTEGRDKTVWCEVSWLAELESIRSVFPDPAVCRPVRLAGSSDVCDRISPLTVAGPRGLCTHFPHSPDGSFPAPSIAR